MKRPEQGRALFYTRDSGGKHEMTPSRYVQWAQGETEKLELSFDGTPEQIEQMIREGCSASGDLFLDYAVSGGRLARDGLNALIKEATGDPQVSHILIPRRDRVARPNDPIDAVRIENALRQAGITLIFMDRVCQPLSKGRRQNLADLIVAMLDYDYAGQYRRELAQKIIHAQIGLATAGFSTGGRPPYGFRRWLAQEDGTPVRQLMEGERVRMPGHHVVWLPGPNEELVVIRRILEMLESTPASRVAAVLTAEGVPTPDCDRYRTDNGVRHRTSGVWHQTTILNIARNPLLLAVVSYGTRSMGDQLRYQPSGPRELEDSDFRSDDEPKVIRNAEDERITAAAKFEPLVERQGHQKLLAKLDERAGTQRGKPRSHSPDKNPLGTRVFDMNCTWPMYREPYNKSFRYKCGLYQQSHGAECAHNHVDGPTATRFVLSCLRQKLLSPTLMPKLQRRIRQLADEELPGRQSPAELLEKQRLLAQVDGELDAVTKNLARARTDDQYDAVAAEFDKLKQQRATLKSEIAALEANPTRNSDTEPEVQAAFSLANRLTELVASSQSLATAGEIIRLANARLFLGFGTVKVNRRILNQVTGGVVTFGAAPPPIPTYQGPTSRQKVNGPAAFHTAGPRNNRLPFPPKRVIASGHDNSLGNVNRGDWHCTFVNETDGLRLVLTLFPQLLCFPGDAVLKYVKPGLYSKRR